MKKILFVFIVLLSLVAPHKSYSIDALEQAYMDQLTSINSDITHARRCLYIMYDYELAMFKTGGGLTQAELNEKQGYKDKLEAAHSKRQDLKMELIERYNKLPEWWVEPSK
jgi:hypothetical protein